MRRREVVRAGQWWHHKVPPVIAIAALALGARPGGVDASDLVDLVLLLASVTGVAAFGHIVNDLADVEADAAGGKPNAMSGRTIAQRWGWVASTLLLGLAPWLILPGGAPARIALTVEVALLVAYSVPPVRLKGRSWLGAVADASYAYAVPFVIVLLTLAPPPVPVGIWAAMAGWGLLLGLRGILWHQVGDVEADRSAGVETVASRMGPSRTETLVASILLPIELVVGVALLVVLGPSWLVWVSIAFALYRPFQLIMLWVPPVDVRSLTTPEGRVRILGFEVVNDYVERWLPIAGLVALALDAPWWWLAVAVHFVTFRNAPRSMLGHDLWVLPDALERILYSRNVWSDVRRVAAQRRARIAAGADPIDDPSARRFVFVVCGPLEHLLTLRTAVHHLRPVTDAEIWVVTDAARNEQVIDVEGIDRIVDVATPAHLDDHQASIWLKTSVHRHVDPGEWCYLDSDIIAIAPGMERVFDARVGPVAFASDITIVENCVDRFSPWAMTCDCLGYGDEHSCGHLREQLAVRFGLTDVPGDWLHWNGGVFVFGPEAAEFLDLWHERAVASFDWPEWKTRDQGALIATVWTLGLQDLPRLPFDFNFIADLNNSDLCLDVSRGWAHHPAGPWYQPCVLHLYTCPLDDPAWDLGADVEAVVVRRSKVRIHRWERSLVKDRIRHELAHQSNQVRTKTRARVRHWNIVVRSGAQFALEFVAMKGSHYATRLTPARLWRSVRRRLGMDVAHVPIANPRQPEGDTRSSARTSR